MDTENLKLNHWVTVNELARRNKQFTLSQLKHLIWKRKEHKGLDRCYRIVGKRGYINIKLFALWMDGELPAQWATDK